MTLLRKTLCGHCAGSRADPVYRLAHLAQLRQIDGTTVLPAGAGTVIGAVIGGKKGAAIGTAVGGGAGTAVVLTTSGDEIRP